MRGSTLILLAIASLAGLSPQANAAAVVLHAVEVQANHDLSCAYLLIGDASGPASSVAVIKLSDYLVGTGNTVTISPPSLLSDWNSTTFNGGLKSLAVSSVSELTYTVLGVYNATALEPDVTIALPKDAASSLLGAKGWEDVFTPTETRVANALFNGNVVALQRIFVTCQNDLGFATVHEQAQLVKFCIAQNGGTVDLTTVPEPTPAGLVGVGLAAGGLMLRQRRGDRVVSARLSPQSGDQSR